MAFHNIFSKKISLAPKNITKIIIDQREKNSLVPSELSLLNIPFEFQHLEVGDYIINNIAIERKSLSDLKSSIINKRIFTQMENLKQAPCPLLIIEGINEFMYQGIIHENALRGFILSTSLKYKMPVIFTQNEKDTALYLSLLAKNNKDKEISLRPSRIFSSKKEQIQFILEGFPNIGPKTADKLIKKFKSLKNIINADEKDLEEILGKKTKLFKELIEN